MGWVLVGWVLVVIATAAAGSAAAALTVEVSSRDGGLFIEAHASGPGSPKGALRMLMDFAMLTDYMPNVDSSYVVGRTDSSTLVQQVVTSRFILPWMFRFTLEFMAHEGGLRFRQDQGSMRDYWGSWRVAEHMEGVEIVYAAQVHTRWRLPFFYMSYVVRRQVAQMMPALMEELAQREVGE